MVKQEKEEKEDELEKDEAVKEERKRCIWK